MAAGDFKTLLADRHSDRRHGKRDSRMEQALTIVVDTREQRPFTFNDIDTIRQCLPSGDYSIQGYEQSIAIERKSLDDWINTILRSRERFCRELNRLQSYDFAAVLIEASPEDILSGSYKSQISPASLWGLTLEMMVRLHPIHVILAGDRPHARAMCQTLLEFAARIHAKHAK